MAIPMTEAQIAEWWAGRVAWHRSVEAARAERVAELRAWLGAGRRIAECNGFLPAQVWPGCSPFLAEYSTPERLAAHQGGHTGGGLAWCPQCQAWRPGRH